MDTVGRVAIQVVCDLGEHGFTRVDILVQSSGQWIEKIGRAMRGEIKSMHDLIHIAQGDATFLETIGDGADREVAGMLSSTEPLFGRGGNQFAVNEQCSSGVMSLRNAILALFQIWPVSLLERNGLFETADSENNHGAISPIPIHANTSARAGLFVRAASILKCMGASNFLFRESR